MATEHDPAERAAHLLQDGYVYGRKYHVDRGDGFPACGIWKLPLVPPDYEGGAYEVAPEEVGPKSRCQRPGCKQRWAETGHRPRPRTRQ